MSKPKFDPNRPFKPAAGRQSSPTRPKEGSFSLEDATAVAAKPVFDESRPFKATIQTEESPATDAAPSNLEIFGRGAGQGVTFGFGDEINGAVQALGQRYLPEKWGGGGEAAQRRPLADLYRASVDSDRLANHRAEATNKRLFLAGNIAGGLVTAPLLTTGGAPMLAARGAPLTTNLGRLMLQGAKTGALGGAISGLGTSEEQTLGGMAKDTAIGAGAGAAVGGVLPVPIRVGQGAARVFKRAGEAVAGGGYIVPTPEAERLAKEGVQITVGRMDPSSAFGRTEELAANKVTGGSVSAARAATDSSARDALLRRAGMPGAKPPTAGAPVSQQLDELGQGFANAYDEALEGTVMSPEKYLGKGKWRGLLTDETLKGAAKTKGAFDLAANDKSIDASPRVRNEALAWLANEAQSLNPAKSGPNAGMVDAKSIQALRTRLRDRIRNLRGEGDDRQKKEIYQRAEEFVSELLEGSLPPERAAQLKSADTAYRNLLAVDDAAQRAFVQNQEFTPAQLLMAIRQRGATPELESLARDAHSVLSAKYAPTGIQVAASESVPLINKVGPAWAAMVNASPTLRAHALGQTSMQQGFRALTQRPALQSLSRGASTLSDLIGRLTPKPQASMTRALQPEGLGTAFPMGVTVAPEDEEFSSSPLVIR